MLAERNPAQRKDLLEFWQGYDPKLRGAAERFRFWRVCSNRRCRRDHACRGLPVMCTSAYRPLLSDVTRPWFGDLIEGFRHQLSVRKARRAAARAVRAKAAAAQVQSAGGTAPAATPAPPSGHAV